MFLLIAPVVVGIILILLNLFVVMVASATLPSVAHTGAVMTAAAGNGQMVVPFVPTGGEPQSAEQYVTAQAAASLFVDTVDSATCTVPSGSGEALTVTRCTITVRPIVIGARIFNNDIVQLFGGPMTITAEDISQTGTNQNVQ